MIANLALLMNHTLQFPRQKLFMSTVVKICIQCGVCHHSSFRTFDEHKPNSTYAQAIAWPCRWSHIKVSELSQFDWVICALHQVSSKSFQRCEMFQEHICAQVFRADVYYFKHLVLPKATVCNTWNMNPYLTISQSAKFPKKRKGRNSISR